VHCSKQSSSSNELVWSSFLYCLFFTMDQVPPLAGGPALFATVLSYLGPILYLGLQASCVSSAFDIIKDKSVQKRSALTFVSLLVNGVYWTLYGIFKRDQTILVPNAVSLLTGSYCMWAFYKHAIYKPTKLYYAAGVAIIVAFVLAALGDVSLVGLAGCLLSVAVSGSPLAVVNTVILEKSTSSLPFWTSLITWVNNFSWVGYGCFVTHDIMLILPNCLGAALASLQMLLFCVYGFDRPKQIPEGFTAEELENPYNV
jgi:uncharacterized protein with PQ loop repeat